MTSIWLDSVSFKLDECIQTANGIGLFKVLIILVSFIFFIDTKNILRECYEEIVTSWSVSLLAKSMATKYQGNKDYIYSLYSQDRACLRGVQPVKELRFLPEREIPTKKSNSWRIPGMEESFKKWFVFDKGNSAKKIVCDNDIFHRRWLMETIMFYLMTLRSYSPFKDQKRFYQIPKLQGAIFQKYKESLIYKYAELHFSKLCSLGNNKYEGFNGLTNNGIYNNNNQLHWVYESSQNCGFTNSLGRCYNGLRRNEKQNGVLKSPFSNPEDAAFLKSLIQYQEVTKGFFDIDIIPRPNSFPEHVPVIKFKGPSSNCMTSCLCQLAGHSSLTLILPTTKTILYFDPCLHTSKVHQQKIINHLLNTVCQLFPKPGGKWTVLSLKNPPKTFKQGECEILVKAFAEQFQRKSKSFTIDPSLLKENRIQMAPISGMLGNPLFSWQMH